MNNDDELKGFVKRGQAAQAAVDQVIADNQAQTRAELLERLKDARVFSIAPRVGAPQPSLAELFGDAMADLLAEVPAKKRRQFAKRLARLEQEIRRELGRAWEGALNEGNWARTLGRADGTDVSLAWAYHLGCLNGSLLAFLRGGK
jgi:hypothetical protein